MNTQPLSLYNMYQNISDIALNFRTSVIDKSGHVVYDGRLIAKHYVKGWFPLDLLAAIPFDLMFLLNRFYQLNTVSYCYIQSLSHIYMYMAS